MSRAAESSLPADGRFELRRALGSGGLGVVYEAYDRQRDACVALKSLRRTSPESITRLKREFRALENLQHPNLVTLHELFEEAGEWFFTMELVEGLEFLPHVRPGISAENENGPRFDEARLRAALAQLSSALIALHGAGKIHRDVKPSNVLVTAEGRVVLLDFGLVTEVDRHPDWTAANAVGTAMYMAPEQAAGRPVGPEADWYAMGVMLYEALTGHPPFQGTTLQMMLEKQRLVPPAPSALCPEAPADLSALCMELLRIDPERRPSGASVLARVLGAAGVLDGQTPLSLEIPLDGLPSTPASTHSHQRSALFMGRDDELAFLEQALADVKQGEPVSVYVHGESGIGKTALMRAFTQRVSGESVIVLSGRCYEREAVAYKAVDGVMESLSAVLRRMNELEVASLIPRRASVLLRVFPALTRIAVFANASGQQAADPQEQRARLFAAFRELFLRLCETRTVIISIDDLQWSDSESLALLSELLRAPGAPALLFVASWRSTDDGREREGIAAEKLDPRARSLGLTRISEEHSRKLARSLLSLSGADPERADAVAEAAGGHPIFIDELARFASSAGAHAQAATVEDALWARVARLDASARRLVEIYALASAPLAPVAAARAARLNSGEFSRHLSALRIMRLVRTSATRGSEAAEPYHDSVRRAVRSHLDAAHVKALHGDLARALRVTGQGDWEQLASHYEAAEELDQARLYMQRAAEQADQGLAFDHAARLYQRVLALLPPAHPERREILVHLGDALANAGRGLEAAQAYELAAEGSDLSQALELSRRAAHQLLITGHMKEGIAALEKVLESEGIRLARTPGQALFSVLMRRLQLKLRGFDFERKDESQVPPHARSRADVCWRAGLSVGMVDPIRGQSLGLRAVVEALRTGDPYRVARAISVYAGYLAAAGRPAEPEVDRILDLAEQLAGEADSAHGLTVVMGARGQARFLTGRFRAAVQVCTEAEHLLRERCVGVHWELNIVRLWGMRALLLLGEYGELGNRLPAILEECRQRRDLYGEVSMRGSVYYAALLAKDQPEQAMEDVRATERRWAPGGGFSTQHYYFLAAKANCALYARDFAAAEDFTEQVRIGVSSSLLKRVQSVRLIVSTLCGRAALARSGEGKREEQLARVEYFARLARKENVDWGTPQADLLQAACELQRLHTEQAIKYLEQAVSGFVAADMALHAACARKRLSEIVGGDRARELAADANAWFELQQMVAPERMVDAMAPGFER